MKDRALDSRGRIPLDLAILNGAKETEELFRGTNVDSGKQKKKRKRRRREKIDKEEKE